jgi:hypothetical protein
LALAFANVAMDRAGNLLITDTNGR